MMTSLKARTAATLLAAAALAIPAGPAFAAGESAPIPIQDWSFWGPLGTFDRAQLQRGFKVYREVCASCHSSNLLRFRNLSQPGGPEFTPAQVRALAAEYKVQDGPNDQGEMFERPARPAEAWPAPHPNEKAARAANGGAYPPDFSVIAKARTFERGFPLFIVDVFTQYAEQGPDYITALLNGYRDPPPDVKLQPGQYYNIYMPGNVISMPPPLNNGQVEYPKLPNGQPQVPETVAQYAQDVSAYLMWVAEPHLEQRKHAGFVSMLFLIPFAALLLFTKRKIWTAKNESQDAVATH